VNYENIMGEWFSRSCRRNKKPEPEPPGEKTDLTETDNTDAEPDEVCCTRKYSTSDESVAGNLAKDSDIYKKMSIHDQKLMAMSMGLSQDNHQLKKAGKLLNFIKP
jgi:hypothetical protein